MLEMLDPCPERTTAAAATHRCSTCNAGRPMDTDTMQPWAFTPPRTMTCPPYVVETRGTKSLKLDALANPGLERHTGMAGRAGDRGVARTKAEADPGCVPLCARQSPRQAAAELDRKAYLPRSLWALTSGFTKRAHHVWIGTGDRGNATCGRGHAVSLMHMAAFRSVQVWRTMTHDLKS